MRMLGVAVTGMQFKDALIWYRKAHGQSQAALAAQFGVTQQTLSKWEAGLLEPSAGARAQLDNCLAPISIGSRTCWVDRINRSLGRQVLFDEKYKILAMGSAPLALFSEMFGDVIGKSLEEIVADRQPGSENPDQDQWRVFPRVRELGFFDGVVRSVHWKAEFHYETVRTTLIQDCWPIVTSEGEVLGHLMGYLDASPEPIPGFVGVKVHWYEVVLNTGNDLKAENG